MASKTIGVKGVLTVSLKGNKRLKQVSLIAKLKRKKILKVTLSPKKQRAKVKKKFGPAKAVVSATFYPLKMKVKVRAKACLWAWKWHCKTKKATMLL